MKQFIKSLIVYFLILYFVIGLFNKGIALPSIFLYLAITILILTLTVLISGPLLKFLTIKSNLFTHFLMSSILLVGVFFLLKIFMTGLYINTYVFEGVTWGTLEIASFSITPTVTIIIVSVISALICSIYRELDSV